MEFAVPLPDGSNLKITTYDLNVDPASFVTCLNFRIDYSIKTDNKVVLLSSVYTSLASTLPSRTKQGPLSL
jgi:hypothetical protein